MDVTQKESLDQFWELLQRITWLEGKESCYWEELAEGNHRREVDSWVVFREIRNKASRTNPSPTDLEIQRFKQMKELHDLRKMVQGVSEKVIGDDVPFSIMPADPLPKPRAPATIQKSPDSRPCWAVIVGVDHYPGHTDLCGACNDAQAMFEYLDHYLHVPRDHIRFLLSATPLATRNPFSRGQEESIPQRDSRTQLDSVTDLGVEVASLNLGSTRPSHHDTEGERTTWDEDPMNTAAYGSTPRVRGRTQPPSADAFSKKHAPKVQPTSDERGPDGPATRKNILSALNNFLRDNRNIKPGDNILFYFAGHGASFSSINPHLYVEETIETICPSDREKTPSQWTASSTVDISDRELSLILEEIQAEKGENVVVILDCCYSGGATRDFSAGRPRSIGRDAEAIDLQALFAPARLGRKPTTKRRADSQDWDTYGHSAHILFAACRPHEVAQETLKPPVYGYFSQSLLAALKSKDFETFEQLRDDVKRYMPSVKTRFGPYSVQNPLLLVLGGRENVKPWFAV